MKVAIFLKILLNAIKGILGVVILCCSIPVHAGNSKAVDKSDLILTLPDQLLASENVSASINRDMSALGSNNEIQATAQKRVPVNVDCDMDVIQNTAKEVSFGQQLFGECDLHFHY